MRNWLLFLHNIRFSNVLQIAESRRCDCNTTPVSNVTPFLLNVKQCHAQTYILTYLYDNHIIIRRILLLNVSHPQKLMLHFNTIIFDSTSVVSMFLLPVILISYIHRHMNSLMLFQSLTCLLYLLKMKYVVRS